jgi:hypothetical protein
MLPAPDKRWPVGSQGPLHGEAARPPTSCASAVGWPANSKLGPCTTKAGRIRATHAARLSGRETLPPRFHEGECPHGPTAGPGGRNNWFETQWLLPRCAAEPSLHPHSRGGPIQLRVADSPGSAGSHGACQRGRCAFPIMRSLVRTALRLSPADRRGWFLICTNHAGGAVDVSASPVRRPRVDSGRTMCSSEPL